jgi:hypothetical protein
MDKREPVRSSIWNVGQFGSDTDHVDIEDPTRGVATWGEAVPGHEGHQATSGVAR